MLRLSGEWDIKLKNKLRKIIFGSITRELILINLVSFILVATGILIAVAVIYSHQDTPDNMVAEANSIYVAVNRYISNTDNNAEEYLRKLGDYYKFNIAITDLDGNILLKTKNVDVDKIDLLQIRKIMQGPGYDGSSDFYQPYDVKIDGKDTKLIAWKHPNINQGINGEGAILCITILPVAAIAVLIYILSRRKVKYIENICHGIKKIANGDLDYRIRGRGIDELAVLANEINKMSFNLKYRIEEERKAEQLKSELITNVSHDLRTPLTSLMAYLQLADDEKTAVPEKDKYVKIAREKSSKLKKLIEDLFEYTKLESGGIDLKKSNVNLVELIEQSIGELAIQAQDKNIAFDKNFSSNSIILNLDSDKMSRAFENIIANAVKYSRLGSSVNINLCELENEVSISFENIPDQLMEERAETMANKVFERFYRGDSSRNSNDGGSGLGLAIAKSIIDLHGGSIWAENDENLFRVSLKLNRLK
jgi:signal transduction histidine kinase